MSFKGKDCQLTSTAWHLRSACRSGMIGFYSGFNLCLLSICYQELTLSKWPPDINVHWSLGWIWFLGPEAEDSPLCPYSTSEEQTSPFSDPTWLLSIKEELIELNHPHCWGGKLSCLRKVFAPQPQGPGVWSPATEKPRRALESSPTPPHPCSPAPSLKCHSYPCSDLGPEFFLIVPFHRNGKPQLPAFVAYTSELKILTILGGGSME